tara:strand:- start:120 stop:566 length:447 start_codon:yes stop_codon:yes gene_type:complete
LDLSVWSSVSSLSTDARLSAASEDGVDRATEHWGKNLPLHHFVFGLTEALFSIARNDMALRNTDILILGMNLAKSSSASRVCSNRLAMLNVTVAVSYCLLSASRELALQTLDSLYFSGFQTEAASWSAEAAALVIKLMELWLFPLWFS